MKRFAFLAVLALLCLGCDKEPVAPTVLVASPSPTPPPEDPLSCVQRNLTLEVRNGAGNNDFLFDFREYLDAWASPRNRSDAALPQTCDFVRVVGWQGFGSGLAQYGDLTGFHTIFKGSDPGNVTIIATHGSFKAIWNGLLIRNHADAIVLGGQGVTRSYRLFGGRWLLIDDGGIR